MKLIHVLFIGFLLQSQLYSQLDTIVFQGGNSVIGEIEGMNRGVLEIDAPYGDENFMVKWLSIQEIYSESKFVVSIKEQIYKGRIASTSGKRIRVFDKDSTYATCELNEIVYLVPYKQGFANRFDAEIELGFNVTKAQDLRQFSLRSSIGYKTDKWGADISYNIIRSSQNNVEPVSRTDGLLNYRRILKNSWYLIGSISSLANTEQLIDLRANSQVGIGKFIISSNKAYWGVKIGVNNNLERFTNESSNRNTWESFLGTELNLYDTGDLEVVLDFIGYTGMSDSGRYRADLNFDTKYELPLDFFIRLGLSLNYDNRPALNASETDYVIRSGIGWEW